MESIDPHILITALSVVFSFVSTLLGYIVKATLQRLEKLETDHSNFQLDVVGTYARKSDLSEIKNSVERLQDYLENKLDKIETKLDRQSGGPRS